MVTEAALRGYLLEEVLAWLLRSSGYELVSAAEEKGLPPEHRVLEQGPHGLTVRGRGARHQADALGQFRYVPPFSLPVRLFVEAKFTEGKVQLPTVRNGHGVVHDINENMVTTLQGPGPSRPRPRHHYSYAIFSTAGFSRNAQEYALAHQISLVDLSMPDFADLRELVRSVARDVHGALAALPAGEVPRPYRVRRHLRRLLLALVDEYMEYAPDADAHPLPESVTEPLGRLAEVLSSRSTLGLVLAFPSAPFVLGLASEDLYAFVDYARAHPTHDINLGRVQDGNHSVWRVRPASDPGAYAMTFSLPKQVESWIRAQEEAVNERARSVKRRLLSTMTVYWLDGDHILTFQLRYAPVQLHQ
ncbi:restriction endonuclease [Streptomyces murinus]|uniref:hypothetical protein n=1 Tax=Streptomyces murinus TaxID=33900 RepID=UPI002E7FE782|nr:hypothetical protein [Streptomyces murinus]WUD08333.1 restriction endonuclease [Streptomyces murinus]